MNTELQPKKKVLLTETAVIAILTFVGYLSAFNYERSYLDFFGVPIYFVDVGITKILLTSFSALSYLCVAFVIFEFCLRIKIDNDKHPYLRGAFLMAVLLVLTEGPILILSYDPSDPLRYYKLTIFSSFLIIVYGFLFKEHIIETEKKEAQKPEDRREKSLLDHAKIRYGFSPILLVILCLFFIVGSGAYGTFVAKNQKEYLTTGSNPTIAIISTYSNNFIGIAFDKKDHSFDNTITLLNKDDIYAKNTYFKRAEIGYLHKAIPSCNIFSNPFEKVFGLCRMTALKQASDIIRPSATSTILTVVSTSTTPSIIKNDKQEKNNMDILTFLGLFVNTIALIFVIKQTKDTTRSLEATQESIERAKTERQIEILPKSNWVIIVRMHLEKWKQDLNDKQSKLQTAIKNKDKTILVEISKIKVKQPTDLGLDMYEYEHMPVWLSEIWLSGAQYYYTAVASMPYLGKEAEEESYSLAIALEDRCRSSEKSIDILFGYVNDMVPTVILNTPASISNKEFFKDRHY